MFLHFLHKLWSLLTQVYFVGPLEHSCSARQTVFPLSNYDVLFFPLSQSKILSLTTEVLHAINVPLLLQIMSLEYPTCLPTPAPTIIFF